LLQFIAGLIGIQPKCL